MAFDPNIPTIGVTSWPAPVSNTHYARYRLPSEFVSDYRLTGRLLGLKVCSYEEDTFDEMCEDALYWLSDQRIRTVELLLCVYTRSKKSRGPVYDSSRIRSLSTEVASLMDRLGAGIGYDFWGIEVSIPQGVLSGV